MDLDNPPKWFIDEIACLFADALCCPTFERAREYAKVCICEWAEKEAVK